MTLGVFLKKIKVVQLIGIGLFVLYVFMILTDIIFEYLGDYANMALSVVLAIISLNMIYKGVLLRSSSTLWFALSLILFAITIVVFELLKIDPIKYYYVFGLIPIISSLINVAIFKNLIYIKVIIINITIIIPIFLMYFSSLNMWWIAGIGFMGIILGVLICRMIKMDKEKV